MMATETKTNSDIDQYLRVIGTSGHLQIGLLEAVHEDMIEDLIDVSESLADKFGPTAKLNSSTIDKYFDFPRTYPFVAVLREEIIGYIIGVPLEHFTDDLWAHYDENLGKRNTIYTYAFAFKQRFHKTGYARVLKKIYYSWMRKRGIQFISGHVVKGVARNFSNDVEILHQFDNWHGTGQVFEYYRRALQGNQNGLE